MDTTDTRLLIPLTEAADLLGICRKTAYNWSSAGTFPIPLLRMGPRRLVVRTADLRKYVETLDEKPPVAMKEAESLPSEPKAHRGPGRPRLGSTGGV